MILIILFSELINIYIYSHIKTTLIHRKKLKTKCTITIFLTNLINF